ncbi:MAP kinase-activating death domain protein-like isoform X7 [Symsagittifera roscoffensis]|uniref:MAP kinase-activating death domain protein-like isoform X7 n=1 Tax=Symsagittifera roscoffensis TaxID=84072 RepID=UPI00307BAD53
MAIPQETVSHLCPRLVDYICFVGARYPNSNSVAQTPELLRRYPVTDHEDFHLPPDVVFFCQPEGCISVSQKRVPLRDASSFVFTLTDKESGVIRYGICLNFFRPFDRKYVAEAKSRANKPADSVAENRNFDQEGFNRGRQPDTISQCSTDSDNLSWNGSVEGSQTGHRGSVGRVKKWKQRNNTLTSLCLISHHPFFSTFRECLFQLRKLIHACNERSCSRRVGGSKSVLRDSVWGVLSGCSLGGVDLMVPFGNGNQQQAPSQPPPPLSPVIVHDVKEIEHWIMRLLSAPIPIPGKTRIEVELLPRRIASPILFALPDDTRFSLCDFPLHLPLELLGVETCMKVITCILLEHKIVLQSRDYNALSMSVLAFVKMLYPLEYMFPVIPLLPTCMNFAEQLLLAPTPYIIGVPATFFLYKQSFRLPDDVWVVDLDSNKITVPLNAEELPRIVEPEATTLRNHLKGALTSMSMPQPIRNLDEVDLSRFTISNAKADSSKSDANVKDAFNPYIFGNDIDSIDVATRVALVKFFSSQNILANHYEHMRTLRLFPRPVVAFQLNSFLKSRPNHSAFTAKLARTQAVEYFCEWSLSPNNMTFQRIQTGLIDPGVIGDKPKWYHNQLTSIVFPVCSEGSSLAAALSVPEEQEDDSDLNLTDESADEEAVSGHNVSTGSGAGGGQSATYSGDVTSLKSSSSYSSLTEFVSDMRSADISGDCLPPPPSSNDVFGQRMLIDQSNYRVPKTLLVPQTEAQSGIETPCVPFHVGDSFTPCKGGTGTNSLLVPPNDASNALTLGSDGSYGGLGTSDTDNDAESIHSESDDPAIGHSKSRDAFSSGGSSSDNRSSNQNGSAEHEFKNPLYDSSATRKAVSSTRNVSGIAAPKRQNDKPVKPNGGNLNQDSGFVSRSQSVSVGTGSARSSRLSSAKSDHNPNTSAYEKGDRTAFVEKTASVISRQSLRSGKAVANQITASGTRVANAFDRSTFKANNLGKIKRDPGLLLEQILGNDTENQQFLSEVVANCMEGQSPGFFNLKKLKKLLENESLRAYVVGKVGNNNDQPVSKDFLEDQEVSKKVFSSMTSVLRAVICGLEESIKAANFNGMASIFMLLEIAYTHVFIRDLTTTRKAVPNASADLSLKKVEGVLDSATKGFNQSLNFILTGEGAFPNLNVPPNSPNVSKMSQNTQNNKTASWLAPFSQSQSQPESPKTASTPVPAGVYSYPSASNDKSHDNYNSSSNGGGMSGEGSSFKPPYADPFANSGPGIYSNMPGNSESRNQKDEKNPKITINKSRPGSISSSNGNQSSDLVSEVDAKRRQMEEMHTMDSASSDSTFSALTPHATSAYPSYGGATGESDGGSSGADTPASASAMSFVNDTGPRRISHHSIRSTDSEFEVTSQGFRQMPQLSMGGAIVPKIPNAVKQVKSVYCCGYRYYNGILMRLENMPPQEENPKKYLFEMVIESNRSPLWDNLQFWEDCFLDAVAAEREAVGMDQSPSEMMTRYKTLGLDEQKRIEAEEDRLLSTTLHNMIAFMLAMKLNPKDIKKKARRLLGRSHIGLGFSKEVNDLLDRLNYLAGNDIDLKPPVSRQLKRQCFVVHAGVDNKGDVLFLEVCEDSVILRSGNGVICERMFYEKLINMSYSPSTKVLCLWKRHGCDTLLSKYYTKKCKQLYYAIKDSMERAATRIRNETPELGGEFCVEDVSTGACGVLQVTLDGISLDFSGQKTFIDLRDIKKCNTKKGRFVLQEYVPERREVIVRKYKSAQANEICYAVLCVFSMVAAASPVSPPTSQGSTNRNSCASPSSPPSVRKQ